MKASSRAASPAARPRPPRRGTAASRTAAARCGSAASTPDRRRCRCRPSRRVARLAGAGREHRDLVRRLRSVAQRADRRPACSRAPAARSTTETACPSRQRGSRAAGIRDRASRGIRGRPRPPRADRASASWPRRPRALTREPRMSASVSGFMLLQPKAAFARCGRLQPAVDHLDQPGGRRPRHLVEVAQRSLEHEHREAVHRRPGEQLGARAALGGRAPAATSSSSAIASSWNGVRPPGPPSRG